MKNARFNCWINQAKYFSHSHWNTRNYTALNDLQFTLTRTQGTIGFKTPIRKFQAYFETGNHFLFLLLATMPDFAIFLNVSFLIIIKPLNEWSFFNTVKKNIYISLLVAETLQSYIATKVDYI